MGSYTPNFNLYKPSIGEKYWGDKVNQNFDTIDTELHNQLQKIYQALSEINYNKSQINRVKTEILTIALKVLMNQALLHAETKDFYSIIADVITPDYPYGFKNTFELPPIGVEFDNSGGGLWTKAIKIPITTPSTEYAIIIIRIHSSIIELLLPDETVKATYPTQTHLAQDFWSYVKTDGNDIRLIDQDYNQLFFYITKFDYINEECEIYVRIPPNTNTIYIAYGNPNALQSSYNDPEQVFDFYDSFTGTELNTDKWNGMINSITYEVNNAFYFKDATKSGNTYWIYDETDTGSQIISKWTPITKFAVEWISEISDTQANQMGEGGIALVVEDNTVIIYLCHLDGDGNAITPRIHAIVETQWQNVNPDYTVTGGGKRLTKLVPSNDVSKFKIVVKGNNVSIYVNDEHVGDAVISRQISKLSLTAGAYGGYPYLNYIKVDELKVSYINEEIELGQGEIVELTTTGDFTTKVFEFPEGIDKILLTADTNARKVYYSTDEGNTWTEIELDTETLLPETAYSLKLKFEFASYVRGYALITW